MDGQFNTKLIDGKRGEYLVAAALSKKGHTITDLTNDLEARLNDIDFALSRNGQSTTLEVKNDMKSEKTGNVFVEYYNQNNITRNYDGWYYYTKAEYICFVQENKHRAHIVSFDDLKKHIKNGYYNVGGWAQKGYLVPISALKLYKSYYELEV